MRDKAIISCFSYYDKKGKPTCAADLERGEVCEFLRTTRFGTVEICLFSSDPVPLRRRGTKGNGTLIPGENCKLFTKTELKEKK